MGNGRHLSNAATLEISPFPYKFEYKEREKLEGINGPFLNGS